MKLPFSTAHKWPVGQDKAATGAALGPYYSLLQEKATFILQPIHLPM